MGANDLPFSGFAEAIAHHSEFLAYVADLGHAYGDLSVEVFVGLFADRDRPCTFVVESGDLAAIGAANGCLLIDAYPPTKDPDSDLKYVAVEPADSTALPEGMEIVAVSDTTSALVSGVVRARTAALLASAGRPRYVRIGYASDNGQGGFVIENELVRSCARSGISMVISLISPP